MDVIPSLVLSGCRICQRKLDWYGGEDALFRVTLGRGLEAPYQVGFLTLVPRQQQERSVRADYRVIRSPQLAVVAGKFQSTVRHRRFTKHRGMDTPKPVALPGFRSDNRVESGLELPSVLLKHLG